MVNRVVAADKVAFAFGLENDIVALTVKVLDLSLERVGLGSSGRPAFRRVLALPQRVKVESILGKRVLVQLVIDVEVLSLVIKPWV